ncbi:MAG TPA: hypothetical protein PKG52_02650 [bacterium]|nr:hypothetical protein [bacterium]HPS29499.1 hypothetical protein [bacterium]
MYFKVYHKKSKHPIATFNEKTIVDFCVSNKESVKNYYFSADGQKDLMEWEVFAVKHSDLFEKKAEERDKLEFKKAHDEGAIDTRSAFSRQAFSIVLLALLFATYLTYYFYQKTLEQDRDIAAAIEVSKAGSIPVQKKDPLEKRAVIPSDSAFGKDVPSQKELNGAWGKVDKSKLPASLGFVEIKEHMDTYLPALKECYLARAKAGDTDLRGTINMKIRITGDGMIKDVLFTDEKYKATLFGDCVISAIKSTRFQMFKSPEQVFLYYWNL